MRFLWQEGTGPINESLTIDAGGGGRQPFLRTNSGSAVLAGGSRRFAFGVSDERCSQYLDGPGLEYLRADSRGFRCGAAPALDSGDLPRTGAEWIPLLHRSNDFSVQDYEKLLGVVGTEYVKQQTDRCVDVDF